MNAYRRFRSGLSVLGIVMISGCATYNITDVPRDESHVHISPKQKARLLAAFRTHSTRGLYTIPNIPPKKLSNARRACVPPGEEEIFALIDATVFGSAKNCLLVGSSGIYIRNGWTGNPPGRQFLPYAEFTDLSITKEGSYDVSIGAINFHAPALAMSRNSMINLLREMQRCITGEPKKQAEHEKERGAIVRTKIGCVGEGQMGIVVCMGDSWTSDTVRLCFLEQYWPKLAQLKRGTRIRFRGRGPWAWRLAYIYFKDCHLLTVGKRVLPLRTTAVALAREYEKNPLRADSVYEGHLVTVTGRISAIESSKLELAAGGIGYMVTCNFGENESKALLNVNKGGSVTITGFGAGITGGVWDRVKSIRFEECRLGTE